MDTLERGPEAERGRDAGLGSLAPPPAAPTPPAPRSGMRGGVLAALVAGVLLLVLLAGGTGVAIGLWLANDRWFGFDDGYMGELEEEASLDEDPFLDEEGFLDEAFFGTPTPLPPGEPVTATVGDGDGLAYTFEAEAGQRVEITMQRRDVAGPLDPYLVLFDPDGVRLHEDDDGGGGLDAALRHRLLDDGTYKVGATSIGGGGEFTLELVLE
jgi:hypothetical protein